MAGVQEEEFDEGEVWDVLQDHTSTEAGARALFASPPRNRKGGNGKKAVSEDQGSRAAATRTPMGKGRSSAPLAIPAGSSSRRRGDEQEEDGEEMLPPPHEWLARKMERMRAALPPEACRGRSKGREMRKVRDTVLPKTAFSEK